MTLFVDASALVAIVVREDDALDLATRLAGDTDRLWSAMSCWETVSAVRRIRGMTLKEARVEVERTAALFAFRLAIIGEAERSLALDAHSRFGKGHHPAALNMGDCFAYACARTNQARLLYKGDDFARTDLA